MSSNHSAEPTPKRTSRQHFRPNVRQATVILPRTGERVKRRVTLRNSNLFEDPDDEIPTDAWTPLLRNGNIRSKPATTSEVIVKNVIDGARHAYNFATSKTGQGIFKCSIAYLLGSLATFVTPIAAILGQQDGKHMVATVTVYFHPARSQGSMHEATLLAIAAFAYAVFISVTSMGLSVLFDGWGQRALGHAIVLIVFCGGGLGLVGWVKQRLGNPLVNVASSLTSLAIITVLTKEGAVQTAVFSDDKITQVLKMVIMGILATTAVCLTINPISARKELKETMITATDAFGDMLTTITRSFLTGSEGELQDPSFIRASDQHKTVFTTLTKNLKEAKWEHYVFGTEQEYHIEARLAACMQRLSQNIGGLRSAASTQFTLLSQSEATATMTPRNGSISTVGVSSPPLFRSGIFSPQEEHGVLAAIDEAPEEGSGVEDSQQSPRYGSVDHDGLSSANSPAEIFTRFIIHLGPSMKSLAYTLKQILDELPYGPTPDYHITINSNFRDSLEQAVNLYTQARRGALELLYQNQEFHRSKSTEVEADFEEVAASCGHFSFSLQDFAEEMKTFLDILDELKLEVDLEPRSRSWTWMMFWRRFRRFQRKGQCRESERLLDHVQATDLPPGLPDSSDRRNPTVFESEKPVPKETYGYRLWKALRLFRRDDVKYAIKVGAGAALFALPSFVPATRSFYSHWRGEWGLLSYMLVCSMTIGDSNNVGYHRFLGTCIGAVFAIVAWIVSQGNPYALATLGWLMSLACFYIILAQGKGPMGRFIMLTYNLSALYAYSLSVKDDEDDDDEGGTNPYITEIVLHRVVAVLSGCLWGLIVTRLVWPISARQKFKDGLSLLWLRMGLIWKRDPLSLLLEGESTNAYMDLREELELQRYLTRLETLCKSASSEFELRGPFPAAPYGRILQSTSRMLDAFHAMNVVILKDLKASEGEADILKYTANERAQLCARISHLFQVLASSLKLEYPLNDALPNTEHARDRLLAKIFNYRKSECMGQGAKDEDFALLYAYALVTGQLSEEITSVGREVERLFGVLNEDLLKLQ
ncbi:MAG: hypothetical protein M1827_004590 [Pycnora praestabilis]|nr:MAG: hypothetical protein M1827_004590 [Pycnora praestabilis]